MLELIAQTLRLPLRREGDRSTGSQKRGHAFLGFRAGVMEGEKVLQI